jgi:tartrate dehydrogenase/decarboxylase/D-malate dehydrogenase
MNEYRIAVIPGDGIGKEVVPEGIRVLDAAGTKYGIRFRWDEFPWSCEYYIKTGRMMPEDGLGPVFIYPSFARERIRIKPRTP